MQLTVLGGGGFRVPLVYRALPSDDSDPRVHELVLYDVDPARLRRIGEVLARLEAEAGVAGPTLRLETDLTEAVRGADFVFSAIRVGGLEGRICDERAALDEGVLGQETTGAGGICYGLRTVPVAMEIARAVKKHAPDAYVINFTNPAGMVTEAMSKVLGDRVVGICDSPVGMFKRVARALDVDRSSAVFDYAGLNHLGWLRRVLVDGVDMLPSLLADSEKLLTIEEGRLFGAPWLQSIGAVPNEYLWYWYYTKDAIAGIEAAKETRGEFLLRQQGGFYAGDDGAGDAYEAWERTRRDREESYMADSRDVSGAGDRDEDDLDGGGYDRVALELMHAIARNEQATLVLNVRNGRSLPGLEPDAVIEVPCVVDANGPRALALDPLAPHAASLVAVVKDVERTAIEASTSGSRELAVRALALHPLVDSVNTARRIFERQLHEVPDLARVFG
jgi:6-phospho-beta-glucosidase